MPHNDYAIVKQEITSLIQNFDYETNPDWEEKLAIIHDKISHFWLVILDREYNIYINPTKK